MSIVLETFSRRHLDGFTPGYFDGEVLSEEFQTWALRNTGKGLTAIINGKVEGFFFITEPVDGVSTVQVYASDEVREKHGLWMGLAFRRGIEEVPRNLGITTLRAEVYEGFGRSQEWVRRLGFEPVSSEDGKVFYERAC